MTGVKTSYEEHIKNLVSTVKKDLVRILVSTAAAAGAGMILHFLIKMS